MSQIFFNLSAVLLLMNSLQGVFKAFVILKVHNTGLKMSGLRLASKCTVPLTVLIKHLSKQCIFNWNTYLKAAACVIIPSM